ncbi:MAG: tRNA lysidine(34) synthetase TilS, partial [Solirubrobacterales bacterium]
MSNGAIERVLDAARASEALSGGSPPAVLAMLSGGADSVCLLHVAVELLGAERVQALHVNHGLRPAADADERFCAELCRALGVELHVERVEIPEVGNVEALARKARYEAAERVRSAAGLLLIATGHTASDQVETVLYRLVSSGGARGIKPRREDGVVRPLLPVWREETEAYCREHGLVFRVDSSNRDSTRGLIREEILPLLRRLHPGAERNLLALAGEDPRLPRGLERTLVELLASTAGTKQADLGQGVRAVREYG